MKSMGAASVRSSGFFISTMDAVAQEVRHEGFVNQQDTYYLNSYSVENMIDLISREDLNRFDNLFQKQTEIKRTGRAKIIDSLF